MPQSEPAKVPVTVPLSPAAARALAAHEPSASAMIQAALEQIASGAPRADAPPIPHTTLVDPDLLARAQHTAAERGADLAEAIEHALQRQPLLLPPVRIAHLLGVEVGTLTRALASNPHAPGPANPDSGSKPLYDARAVCAWWPTRRRSGRPVTKQQPSAESI